VGVSDVSPAHLLDLTTRERTIELLLASRVPRTLALVLAGVSLGVAGLLMQMLTRNRFVEPSTAGTVESASLGMLVGLLFLPDSSPLVRMLVSAAFALLGTAIFLQILRRIPLRSMLVVPLVGIMLGGVVSAVTAAFALTFLAYAAADRFTVAGMGEDFTTNLGLNYSRLMVLGLVIVSLVTASVVSTVGIIPFLGLVVPNLVALTVGDNMRRSLPFVALLGAGLVLLCDIVGRSLNPPYEIPIGTIFGVLGSAVFLVLILRRRDVA